MQDQPTPPEPVEPGTPAHQPVGEDLGPPPTKRPPADEPIDPERRRFSTLAEALSRPRPAAGLLREYLSLRARFARGG